MLLGRLPRDAFVTAFLGVLTSDRCATRTPAICRRCTCAARRSAARGRRPSARGAGEPELHVSELELTPRRPCLRPHGRADRGAPRRGDVRRGAAGPLRRRRLLAAPPKELVRAVHEEVTGWADGISDDAVALALRRTARRTADFRLNGARGGRIRATGVDQLLSATRSRRWWTSWPIRPGRPSRAALASGHYANVLKIDDRRGLALSCDGVGSKVIVGEQSAATTRSASTAWHERQRRDLRGRRADRAARLHGRRAADPEVLEQIGIGLKEGAEQAGVEIPGGELAVLPELIRGHPSPTASTWPASAWASWTSTRGHRRPRRAGRRADRAAFRRAASTRTAERWRARRSADLDERPLDARRRASATLLLEPTVIYVRAVLELLRSRSTCAGWRTSPATAS